MKNVNYYMNLPYNYIIQPIRDESGEYFYAKILELDGCQSTGETFEEAYEGVVQTHLWGILTDSPQIIVRVKIYEKKTEKSALLALVHFCFRNNVFRYFLATYVFVYIVLVVFCRPYHRTAFQ